MLNLCQHLLTQARRYSQVGANERALRSFGRLASLRILPDDVAEETQANLAELLLGQREYAKARRHLTAALAHDPNNPDYYYLMARALDEDPRGSREKAMQNYRLCLQKDSENPYFHCDAGLFALEQGLTEEGLGYLRKAVKLAPSDVELLSDVVRGLQENGLLVEAREVAIAARFQNGRDPRFLRLWNEFRFRETHLEQKQTDKRHVAKLGVMQPRDCLVFEELTTQTPSGRQLIRRDNASRPAGPHFMRMPGVPGRKHA
jgi:tetratricopeptide (TPR) repeat protein